ncbi:MAG: UvrB/UvrC motif-containing protein [Saccharofermentanales bacterium]
MKCSRCSVNDATILIRQVINGKESEYSLCENCAKAIGLSVQAGPGFNGYPGSFFTGNFFSALNQLGNTSQVNTGVFVPGKEGSGVCPHCNTTLAEFKEKGRLGCSHCYEAFDDQLTEVFRRIQSGEIHRGRKLAEAPESSEMREIQDRIVNLQELIKKAVEVEDYESAAKHKTEIARLKLESAHLKVQQDKESTLADKLKKKIRKSPPAPENRPETDHTDRSGGDPDNDTKGGGLQ